MKKMIVTGGTGLLGKWLFNNGDFGEFQATGYSSRTLDVTDEKQIDNAFKDIKPDAVLHLAAYTDVYQAEIERLTCLRVNVTGTQNITEACKKYNAKMIYISTEYVFDGEQGNYSEEDETNPVNYYGMTKREGEKEVQKYNNSVIIRTLFKPRPFKHPVVPTDMWTSGGYIDEIGKELVLALKLIDKLPRLLHIGLQRQNLYDLALQSRNDLKPVMREDLRVKLPEDASLNCYLWERIKYDSGITTNNR